MPRRDDLTSILVIGSGPIVIGQACEFDYSGTQACRVLREEGYRVDPRQLQPGDDHDRPRLRRPHLHRAADAGGAGGDHRPRASRRRAADARRPDRPEHRHGPVRRGTHRRARATGDDRGRRHGHRHRRGPRAVQGGDGRDRPRRSPVCHRPLPRRGRRGARRHRAAGDHPPGVHPRWPRHRHRHVPSPSSNASPRPGSRQPDRRDPRRGVDRRLEGVRARGDARPRRQLRGDLLDRERRPDGRAHRRLDHRGPGPDADRRRVPAHARRGVRLHPPRRRRDGRFERAVRPRPGHRTPGRDRDEPAVSRGRRRWPPRRPDSRSPRWRPSWRSDTRSTRSPTTSPGPRRRRSSR